eukprot:13406984-Alexandrium_andersonii.AAC.1
MGADRKQTLDGKTRDQTARLLELAAGRSGGGAAPGAGLRPGVQSGRALLERLGDVARQDDARRRHSHHRVLQLDHGVARQQRCRSADRPQRRGPREAGGHVRGVDGLWHAAAGGAQGARPADVGTAF